MGVGVQWKEKGEFRPLVGISEEPQDEEPSDWFLQGAYANVHAKPFDVFSQKRSSRRLLEICYSTQMIFIHQLPASQKVVITCRDKVHECHTTAKTYLCMSKAHYDTGETWT